MTQLGDVNDDESVERRDKDKHRYNTQTDRQTDR